MNKKLNQIEANWRFRESAPVRGRSAEGEAGGQRTTPQAEKVGGAVEGGLQGKYDRLLLEMSALRAWLNVPNETDLTDAVAAAIARAHQKGRAAVEGGREDTDAMTELLATLDELYPLPDDDKRVERAGRTACALKRWMAREHEAFERIALDLAKRAALHGRAKGPR